MSLAALEVKAIQKGAYVMERRRLVIIVVGLIIFALMVLAIWYQQFAVAWYG